MGMYTHLSLRGYLRPDAPARILDILADRVGVDDEDFGDARQQRWAATDPHPFFRCARAHQVLSESRWNGAKRPGVEVIGRRITCCNEIKNYDGEIEHFLDWLSPALERAPLLGGVHYEEWYRAAPLVWRDGGLTCDTSVVYDPEGEAGLAGYGEHRRFNTGAR